MEENEINLYYQYNSKTEINNPNSIKRPYFLIESEKRNGFEYRTIETLLTNDGVDLQKVARTFIEESHSPKVLRPFSKGNFNNYKERNDFYVHLELEEQNNTQENEIDKKKLEYNTDIANLDKCYKEISEEMKKIKNSNLISDKNIYDIIKKKEEEETNKKNNQMRSSFHRLSEEKKDIYVLYLFGSLFDLKSVNYEEKEYFEEIKYIYNLFNSTPNISAELRFEPLINLNDNNFKDYFENIPDIIHININSNYLNEELNYNNLGETINTKFENILENLSKQKDISKVKLLILSSDKNGKIKDHFKKIKNIIYLTDLKKQQCENKTFYQDFYSNILKRYSIEQAFEKSNHINFSKKISSNQEIYILSPEKLESDEKKYKNRNKIVINKNNCSLNLDFVKYNYHSILGRNLQIKNCIEKIQEKSRNILVYGGVGAGKKSLVQMVGKYFYERQYLQYFSKIEYIELYDLDNIEEILTNKIKEINYSNNANNEDDISAIYSKKILLIINFNFLIDEETKLGNVENAINSNKNKYKNIIFLYTCTTEKISSERLSANKASIKLDKLRKNKDVPCLLNHIVEEIFDSNKERDKIKNFLKLKKIGEYPNYFYLIALYFQKIGVEKTNINNNTMKTAEYLLNEFFKEIENKYRIKKIISIFYILKLGIREDILNLFFEEREIKNMKSNLKYIIRSEGDKEGYYFLMDGYFQHILTRIFSNNEKYSENTKQYLLTIIENYAKVFRYIVNNSNFYYDFCQEFHAGINKGIWFSLHEKKFKEIYDKFCLKNKNKKIFFDGIRYFNNIKIIFENEKYLNIIKENLDEFREYLSQIIICLPTILYFVKNNLLLKKTMGIFEKLLIQFESEDNYWKNDMIRFNIFKYWISNEPDDFKNIKKILSESKEHLYKEILSEINLIEIYNIIQEKIEFDRTEFSSYKDCSLNEKDDYFNLIRLNILHGKAEKKIDYFQEAYHYAKKNNNNILIKLTLIELAEYYLIIGNFDEFNNCVTEYQRYKDDNKDLEDKFDIKINNLIESKNEKYKGINKNKLYFYTSELFFEYDHEYIEEDMKQTSLRTEANNSFYLKYNINSRLYKDMKDVEIIFENVGNNFLTELNNKFQNPSKFIYIGCDFFNKDGQIFYLDEDDYRTKPISNIEFSNIISECKNKPDMIILWFINSEIIAKEFEKNNFTNIIYVKQNEILIKLMSNKSYFYFYIQRCLYKVIADFVVNLDKKTLKDNFEEMKKELIDELEKFKINDKYIMNEVNKLLSEDIIGCINLEDKIFFDDMNISRKSSFSNNNIMNELDSSELFIDKEFYEEEKKIDFKKLNLTNMVFDEYLENFYFLIHIIHKRYYGKKHLFSNAIQNLINNRIINIFGKPNSGKTALCLELCKYFYMKNYFKKGIYYYSNCKLKDLKNHQFNEKENKNEKILIIIDDENNVGGCLNFINNSNPNSYFIIVTTESLKKNHDKNKDKYRKKPSKKNNCFIKCLDKAPQGYLNANLPLSIKFKEEFYYYVMIKLMLFNNDLNMTKKLEEKMKKLEYKEEQVYINEIIELVDDK